MANPGVFVPAQNLCRTRTLSLQQPVAHALEVALRADVVFGPADVEPVAFVLVAGSVLAGADWLKWSFQRCQAGGIFLCRGSAAAG